MPLTSSETEKYKNQLVDIQKKLEEELKKISENLDFGDDNEGSTFDEETDEAEELSNMMPVSETLKNQLSAVLEAKARFADGTYGKCLQCGGEIEHEVLDAAPESSLCVNCKRS